MQKTRDTIEDPVEYRLKGINQIEVKPAIGLDFKTILPSILRQDTDVILIGEIRDEETAKVAIDAALTGHLVFATLHTNDAVSTIIRLLNLGIKGQTKHHRQECLCYTFCPLMSGIRGVENIQQN